MTKKIKAFESQKRVLQHDIAKTVEQRRSNDRTILAQQSRIDGIEEKLAVIANVLRAQRGGAALSPEDHAACRPNVEVGAESVPVSQFDKVQTELSDMRMMLSEREAQLTELDGTIEPRSTSERTHVIIG